MRHLLLLTLALSPLLLHGGEYQLITRGGIIYHTYRAKPAELTLHWKDPATGKPYQRLANLQTHFKQHKRQIHFLMNAGIYEPGYIPSGLHIQAGKQLNPINLKNGYGNFFLKPNGVFFITHQQEAHILSSSNYATAGLQPRLAVQSGPLLLQNGQIHPAFSATSNNRRHRNGVGVTKDGHVLFICTQTDQKKYVTLHEFAQLFLDHTCQNALFLDGDLSTMIIDPVAPIGARNSYAAIFAITTPMPQDPQ